MVSAKAVLTALLLLFQTRLVLGVYALILSTYRAQLRSKTRAQRQTPPVRQQLWIAEVCGSTFALLSLVSFMVQWGLVLPRGKAAGAAQAANVAQLAFRSLSIFFLFMFLFWKLRMVRLPLLREPLPWNDFDRPLKSLFIFNVFILSHAIYLIARKLLVVLGHAEQTRGAGLLGNIDLFFTGPFLVVHTILGSFFFYWEIKKDFTEYNNFSKEAKTSKVSGSSKGTAGNAETNERISKYDQLIKKAWLAARIAMVSSIATTGGAILANIILGRGTVSGANIQLLSQVDLVANTYAMVSTLKIRIFPNLKQCLGRKSEVTLEDV